MPATETPREGWEERKEERACAAARYRRGERLQPWRIPEEEGNAADSKPLTCTDASVEDRRRRAQLTMPSEAPRVAKASKRKVLSTVSYALAMSRKRVAPGVFAAYNAWGSREVKRTLSAICLPGRKAVCSRPMAWERAGAKREARIRARRRYRVGRRVMGRNEAGSVAEAAPGLRRGVIDPRVKATGVAPSVAMAVKRWASKGAQAKLQTRQ